MTDDRDAERDAAKERVKELDDPEFTEPRPEPIVDANLDNQEEGSDMTEQKITIEPAEEPEVTTTTTTETTVEPTEEGEEEEEDES